MNGTFAFEADALFNGRTIEPCESISKIKMRPSSKCRIVSNLSDDIAAIKEYIEYLNFSFDMNIKEDVALRAYDFVLAEFRERLLRTEHSGRELLDKVLQELENQAPEEKREKGIIAFQSIIRVINSMKEIYGLCLTKDEFAVKHAFDLLNALSVYFKNVDDRVKSVLRESRIYVESSMPLCKLDQLLAKDLSTLNYCHEIIVMLPLYRAACLFDEFQEIYGSIFQKKYSKTILSKHTRYHYDYWRSHIAQDEIKTCFISFLDKSGIDFGNPMLLSNDFPDRFTSALRSFDMESLCKQIISILDLELIYPLNKMSWTDIPYSFFLNEETKCFQLVTSDIFIAYYLAFVMEIRNGLTCIKCPMCGSFFLKDPRTPNKKFCGAHTRKQIDYYRSRMKKLNLLA